MCWISAVYLLHMEHVMFSDDHLGGQKYICQEFAGVNKLHNFTLRFQYIITVCTHLNIILVKL